MDNMDIWNMDNIYMNIVKKGFSLDIYCYDEVKRNL